MKWICLEFRENDLAINIQMYIFISCYSFHEQCKQFLRFRYVYDCKRSWTQVPKIQSIIQCHFHFFPIQLSIIRAALEPNSSIAKQWQCLSSREKEREGAQEKKRKTEIGCHTVINLLLFVWRQNNISNFRFPYLILLFLISVHIYEHVYGGRKGGGRENERTLVFRSQKLEFIFRVHK